MTPTPDSVGSRATPAPNAPWMIRPAKGWHRKALRRLPRQLTVLLAVVVIVLLSSAFAAYLGYASPRHSRGFFLAQMGLMVVGAFAIAVLAWRMNRQLLEPLAHLRNWAQRMRSGNLSVRIPVPPAGEFADLARDINSLSDELKLLTQDMNSQVQAQTERLGRKTRSLEILYDVASSLNKSRSLEELLEGFLDTFMDLVRAKAATVRLLTENGPTRLVACRGLDPETAETYLPADSDRAGRPIPASSNSSGATPAVSGASIRNLQPHLLRDGHSEIIVIPVHYQDRILGVYNLFLDQPLARLTDDMRELLDSISSHLGLAIEKARLDNDARRLAIIEERNMIGNELHDSLAQSLVSMRIHIKMLGEMLFRKDITNAENEVRRLHISLVEAHASLRELLANFRSRMDERGLVPAIADMVVQFKEETGIAAFFHNECSELVLSPAQEIQIFRITQEALANIRKHSNARTTRIMLSADENSNYELLIEDDGLGITLAPNSQRGEHVGLSIMRERAARLPGALTIESEPGEGTRICLTFAGANQDSLRRRATGG